MDALFTYSVPVKFALMFLMVIMANKEYTSLSKGLVLNDLGKTMPWKDLFTTVGLVALYTYLAGLTLQSALLDIKL